MTARYVVAVDVGTGSARAAVVSESGRIIGGSVETAITTLHPIEGHYEQSGDEIWQKSGECVREAIKRAQGLAFDATCSLVVLGSMFEPVSISTTNDDKWNIIVWMDHRAAAEAAEINATSHPLLKYVGGAMSLEMEPPKMLWLKKRHSSAWKRAHHFLDLADFLTFRATGCLARSACTVTCKWAYDAPNKRWDPSAYSVLMHTHFAAFFAAVGLEDLCADNFAKIGRDVRPVGDALGPLTTEAAAHFGLTTRTVVSSGLIDAHAGGLGLIGAHVPDYPLATAMETRLAIISGTSTCLMACASSPLFIKGVWGPYLSAMVPGMWLAEGGESATGALLDHLVMSHPAGHALKQTSGSLSAVYEHLNERVNALGASLPSIAFLTKEVHILPYFHGNRAPRADSSLRGTITGLTLDTSLDSLAVIYLAAVQALAHGTKHIVDEMNASGYAISLLFITGGLSKNPIFVAELADVCNAPVVLAKESETVLLGAGIAAAAAYDGSLFVSLIRPARRSSLYPSIAAAQSAMSAAGRIVTPSKDTTVRQFRRAKHAAFLLMYDQQIKLREVMRDTK